MNKSLFLLFSVCLTSLITCDEPEYTREFLRFIKRRTQTEITPSDKVLATADRFNAAFGKCFAYQLNGQQCDEQEFGFGKMNLRAYPETLKREKALVVAASFTYAR